jgi:hypothetical protein
MGTYTTTTGKTGRATRWNSNIAEPGYAHRLQQQTVPLPEKPTQLRSPAIDGLPLQIMS